MIEIKILSGQGYSQRQIAKQLHISRNTVKRYLQTGLEPPRYSPRTIQLGKLSAFSDYLLARQQAASPERIPATVLWQEILAKGYQGSISLLRAFLRQHCKSKAEAVIRFETPPGKQMQIDWASFRQGSSRLSALIATLGYSRMSYVKFVEHERIEALLEGLQHAFEYFGGVTEHLLFDNMKTVVLQRHAYGEGQHRFHPALWDFAKHYGFIPKLCQPYRAQTKGKVERFIAYLRHSFYIPLRATLAQANLPVDVHTANQEVQTWLMQIANCRVHATLNQRPVDLFGQEQSQLKTLAPAYLRRSVERHLTAQAEHSLRPITLPGSVLPMQHELTLYQRLLEQSVASGAQV